MPLTYRDNFGGGINQRPPGLPRGVFVRRRAAVCAGSAQLAYALREAVVDGVERIVDGTFTFVPHGLPLIIPDTAPRLD